MFSSACYLGRMSEDRTDMPGGIGPVNEAAIARSTSVVRQLASTNNTNEIYYNLDCHRVIYMSTEECLYFVDSPQGNVTRTIKASLKGLNSNAAIEQVYLDPHKCFNGARRIKLTAAQANTIFVALRLSGIDTRICR